MSNLFLSKFRPYAWIALAVFLLYAQTLFFNFSYLDDNVLILNNQRFLAGNIGAAFTNNAFFSATQSFYRPILTLSLMLDYQIGGLSPFIYHFSNVIYHAVACCLLFAFLFKLGFRRDLSFIFSLFFAVSPVLNHAVAWIPGRNDILFAIFALASFIFLLNFWKNKKWGYLAAHFVFLGLAFLTKESAVVLPALASIYYFLVKKGNWREMIVPAAGWIAVAGLWVFVRHLVFTQSFVFGISDSLNYLVRGVPALMVYLGKAIFPFNLSVYPVMADSTLVFGLMVLAALAFLIFISKGNQTGWIIFGAFWFISFLAVSFLVPTDNFLEHRAYLPLAGIIILMLGIGWIEKINLENVYSAGIVISVFLGLFLISFLNSGNYSDRLSFWQSASRSSSHSGIVWNNLGAIHYLNGDFSAAEDKFKRALEANPNEPLAHNNLGLIYHQRGELGKAEAEYLAELKINPYSGESYYNLGILYANENKIGLAVESWKKVLEINPNSQDAINALKSLAR
ncbi:MAG: tetratricopeptide repeat protein [Candidatus Pacebacteria bacterium]|nr:tetratricopeptide repeat protein [Candidatus Paceibacterota bacterium]